MDSTGGTQTLTPVATEDGATGTVCPRCAEPAGQLPAGRTSLFDNAALRRCFRCGVRYTEETPPRLVLSCSGCGLPFLAEDLLPHVQRCCGDCEDGRTLADLPDPSLAAATESEVRVALDAAWRFVTTPALGPYLNRLSARIAERLQGAPGECKVVVVDDDAVRMLGLPSGVVVLSTGALAALSDEAELAFVIARELAHAAAGHTAVRLVRLGLGGVARTPGGDDDEVWLQAVGDLMTLGFGRLRERDADARAVQLVGELGYDARSILRYIDRMDDWIGIGDPRVRELAIAQSPPRDRRRRLAQQLAERPAASDAKVNREVFRRAAGPAALEHGLQRLESLDEALGQAQDAGQHASRDWGRIGWTVATIALLAALILLAGLLLS